VSNAGYILLVLVLYKCMLLAVGLWAQRRVSSKSDFFLGGRGLGPFVAALSYSASSSSAWMLLGLSGLVYTIGVSAVWIMMGSVLGMVVAWVWVAPRLRRQSLENNDLTLVDFIAGDAEGKPRRRIIVAAAIVISISFALYVAAQFQGAGNLFSSTFGLSLTKSVILGAIIVMLYTMLGGFWAVSVTDAIQGIVMLFAVIALPIASVIALGGASAFLESLHDIASSTQLTLTGANVGLLALGMIIGNLSVGASTLGQPHLLVRFMALKDDRSVRQGLAIAVTWFTLVQIGVMIFGLAAIALQLKPENPENVFFLLTNELFHPLVAGVIIAAILSAIMSTADSQLLVSASVLSHDLGWGKSSGLSTLTVSRLCVVGLVIFSVILTLYLPEAIFSRALFAWVALGAAFGPSVVYRLAGRRAAPMTTLVAILCGFSAAIVFYLLPNAPGDFNERVIPIAIGFLILVLGPKQQRA